jgi:hypothetical protein
VRSQNGARFVAALRVTSLAKVGTAERFDPGTGGLDDRWVLPAPGGQAVPGQPPTGLAGAQGAGTGPAATARRSVILANPTAVPVTVRLAGLAPADAGTEAGETVTVPAGRLVFQEVRPSVGDLVVEASAPGILAAPDGRGVAMPSSLIGGLPAGPVIPSGSAAAP